MDAFVIHPYGDNSSQPPATAHPTTTTIGIADYDKLVALLGEAFDGTAQPGSELPIFYGEFGVESEIPTAKASLYTGTEPAVTRPVRRDDPGGVLRAGARARLLPADGRRRALLPLARRARATGLAVGNPLRGRDAEDEQGARHRLARPHDRRLDRALPRRRAPGEGDVSPVRHAFGRKARRLPHELPLRPRLPLLGATRERRDPLDEARDEGLGRGRRAGAGRHSERAASSRGRTATRSG